MLSAKLATTFKIVLRRRYQIIVDSDLISMERRKKAQLLRMALGVQQKFWSVHTNSIARSVEIWSHCRHFLHRCRRFEYQLYSVKTTGMECITTTSFNSVWVCVFFYPCALSFGKWESSFRLYKPRSIFCDSSTWFKIRLATASPWPSSNTRNIFPWPLASKRLSTSIKSFPLAQQQVRWQQGAGMPMTSTSSTLDKSIFLLTYDGPKQKSRKGPHRTGWTRFTLRWLGVNLSGRSREMKNKMN